MVTRLHRHELSVAERYDRLNGGRSAWSAVARWLCSPLGAFFVNTPLYLLPAEINLQPRHRVLEVGCAHGAGLRFLTARFPFRQPPVGVDASLEALSRGARTWSNARVPLVTATASRLPFAPESFDLVLAGHTVRHLSDEGLLRFLFEAERVLRPGGRVLMVEPAITWGSTLFYRLLHHEPVRTSADVLMDGTPDPGRDPYDSNQAIPTLLATRDRDRFHRLFPDLRVARVDWFSFAAYPLSGGFKPWSLVGEGVARHMLRLERALEPALGRFAAFRMLLIVEKASER